MCTGIKGQLERLSGKPIMLLQVWNLARVQLVNAITERDVARAEIQDVRAERDEVIRLAKVREAARIQTMF